ncbi:DnaJ domain-containing protein [Gorgonomyces haynaldii]|nr:DnaJ domain-containing protein [Gorgonomyces haynaldii]
MPIDYYKTLGIDRSADQDAISKSYRVLALNNHPDRNPNPDAKDIFNRVAEAFHVLSNSQRRAVYDQYGHDGLLKGVPNRDGFSGFGGNYTFHGNAEEVFNTFFGTKNPFADFFANHAEPKQTFGTRFGGLAGMSKSSHSPPKDKPIVHDLVLTLEQLYKGCVKKIQITRQVLNDDAVTTSPLDKILTIEVPPGTKQGTKIIFPCEGDQGPNVIPADIVFLVKEAPHPRFKRQGNNLIYETSLPLIQVLTGASVDVETLDGRLLKIPINDSITPDFVKKVPREGMPFGKERGELHIHLKTVFPSVLTEQQKQMLKKAFQ